jgi:hypothetical protein
MSAVAPIGNMSPKVAKNQAYRNICAKRLLKSVRHELEPELTARSPARWRRESECPCIPF